MTKIIIKDASWEVIKTLDGDVTRNLLKQLTDKWVEISYACHTGICWACMCLIEKWEDSVIKNFKGEPWFPLADEEIMTCIAGIKEIDGDVILKKIY